MPEQFSGFDVGMSDEDLLRRVLELAQRPLPEQTRRPSGASAEELATFPVGDEVIRSNYGKLPGVREVMAAMRVAGALGKGAIEGGTQAVTATGRAMQGKIAPEDMAEEALNTALAVGGAGMGSVKSMSRMTPDQLNMFFGPKAVGADLQALERAKKLEKMGAGIGRIRNEGGGWFRGGDGDWRYEVPDDGLKVDAEGFRIEHPEIAKGYPGVLDSFTTIVDDVNPARPSNMGSWDNGSRTMRIFSKDPAERRSIAAHELQHIIDHHEKRAPGMGIEDPQLPARRVAMAPEIAEAKRMSQEYVDQIDTDLIKPEYQKLYDASPYLPPWDELTNGTRRNMRDMIVKKNPELFPQELRDKFNTARDIVEDAPSSPYSIYGQYKREVGEVGARNVQTRLDWTENQRKMHPQLTEDVPRDEQWVAKRAPQYAWNELPDADAVDRALTVAASRPAESFVYRAGDELSPEGSSGYQAVPGKPSVVTIPGYGKVEARPVQPLLDAAETYMRSIGRSGEHDVAAFPKLDEERAARIAEAYARMKHDPTDPKVRQAYDAMADETMAQYEALKGQGLDFHFLRDGEPDPYAKSPSLGYPDLIKNGRLSVFPTEQGFGSNELFDPSANPLLKKVGKVGDLENATVNDAFRAVHDAHGHFGPGNPFFRAPGEERAWYAHSRMYSPEAVPAMTSETRGQNSWLNFGPHKEHNKTALGADTIFADQKTGLMDDWTWALDPDALYPRRAAGGRVQGKTLSQTLEEKHPDVDFHVSEGNGSVKVHKMVVPKDRRNQGLGTRFMRDVTDYADAKGVPVGLTPDSAFGGSKPRLEGWYKGLGFVRNTGRNADYSVSESHIRQPIPQRAAGGRVTGARASLLEDVPVQRALNIAYDDHPSRIPQRLPTGKKSTENPDDDLIVDRAALESTPKLFDQNVGLVKNYPNMPAAMARLGSKKVADAFVEHVKSNLLWLHDQYAPEVRDRSKLWYKGANKIANDWAGKYKMDPASVAGVMAALSPQKDWFMNVSLAGRVLDAYHGLPMPTSQKMLDRLESVFPSSKYPGVHDIIKGKTLHELGTPAEKAMWIRLFDETHNDRSHRIVSPEGEFGDFARTQGGDPKGTGWGSVAEIAKAVGAVEANGDRSKLSRLMGERHKVRNFYNNILSPDASRGDVTIDTHAVAAGLLRPLAGASLEVAHNFGNYAGKDMPQAGGSSASGVQGLYPLYAEAYRQAAKERGVLPREMQSITWEAVRGLFPENFKSKKNVAAVDKLWHKYRNGTANLDDTRSAVHDLAGGIKNPDWFGSDLQSFGESGDPSYKRELDQDGPHGGDALGLGSGTRNGASDGSEAFDDPFAEKGLNDYLYGAVQRARGGRIRSIGAMATRWSPRPALMPDIDRDPVSDALAAVRRRF